MLPYMFIAIILHVIVYTPLFIYCQFDNVNVCINLYGNIEINVSVSTSVQWRHHHGFCSHSLRVALIAQAAQDISAGQILCWASEVCGSLKEKGKDCTSCAKNSAKSLSLFCKDMCSWPKSAILFWSTLISFPCFDVSLCLSWLNSAGEFLLIC